jgi:hypothetical protein
MGRIHSPEMSVNDQSTLRNNVKNEDFFAIYLFIYIYSFIIYSVFNLWHNGMHHIKNI